MVFLKVYEIYNYLNSFAPFNTAMDFDNVGLLVGDWKADISGIVVTLDCYNETIDQAISLNANLIITHHPVIFNGVKKIPSTSLLHRLIANNITVISMHTNLDIANGGVNDVLCEKLGLTDCKVYNTEDGFPLRIGELKSPTLADNFAKSLKAALNVTVKYSASSNLIKRVAVCSGSGGDFIFDSIKFGADALVTSDIKHNFFVDAALNDFSLFDCGHFNTEDVIITPLCDLIKNNFDIPVFESHFSKIKYL